MQKDVSSLIKTALIEYVKSHDEYNGKIMDFINHIDEAIKVIQSLPIDAQNDLKQTISNILIANGISSVFFK